MKKTITIAALALVVLACHRKTAAANAAAAEKAKMDAAHTEMISQGRTVYNTRCNKCHALKPVENYTADRWTNILKSMIPKAKLNDTESQQVTAYVMDNAKK